MSLVSIDITPAEEYPLAFTAQDEVILSKKIKARVRRKIKEEGIDIQECSISLYLYNDGSAYLCLCYGKKLIFDRWLIPSQWRYRNR